MSYFRMIGELAYPVDIQVAICSRGSRGQAPAEVSILVEDGEYPLTRKLTPAQARQLAALLIRGADLIEGKGNTRLLGAKGE